MVVWQVEEVRQVEGAGQFSEYAADMANHSGYRPR